MGSKELHIILVVQARTGSTRLPDKIMMKLAGKPLLVRRMERITASKSANDLVVATTELNEDVKLS